MVVPLRQLIEAGCRRLTKRIEQTKLDLVWEVRYSVHTPLGERLLQLAYESIPTHRLVVQFMLLTMTNLLFYFTFRKIILSNILNIFTNAREAIASKKNIWSQKTQVELETFKAPLCNVIAFTFYHQYPTTIFIHRKS